jgi:glycosyltransferase involved in cell wall biosynthesis
MTNSLVSVVVTTKNEEKNIQNCLSSVKKQSYPADLIEIIVVDNNSQDKTKKIAKGFTDKVFDYGPERSAQRNFGIRKAQGQYILFLDADMFISKDLLIECVEKMEIKQFVGLYIPEVIIGEGFWVRVRNFERSFYNATVIDCVRFISKDAFLQLNGFDESMSGPEDWDFDRRIRRLGKVSIAKKCIFHNESGFNIKAYLKKKMYYAKSFDGYLTK